MHIIPLAATEIERKILNIPDHWSEITDQAYDPESIHAQSGLAVAEAVSQKSQIQIIEQDVTEVIPTLNIHKLTQEEYNNALANGTLDENALYLTPDDEYATTDHVNSEILKLANTDVQLQNDIDNIKTQLVDLLYKPIEISSFSHNAGTKERGTTVTEVTLSWSVNKIPTLLSIDGETIDVTQTGKTISGLALTYDNNKTWTLSATDDRNATATKTTSITFCNGIYYGVGTVINNFTSAFVTGLSKKLQTSKAYDFTVNPTAQYIYYAVPKRLGTVIFKVGGFQGGFEAPETVSVTNSSGYTEDYYVYRSTNQITGSTTVDVT